MFISSFYSKLLIWVPVSFPSLLVPCTFCFISLCIAFTSSSILHPCSVISVSFLITSVLNCAPDILAISLSLSFFLEFWSVLSFGPYFFVSVHLLCCKGWSLRYSPGQGNPLQCIVAGYVVEGSERERSAHSCTKMRIQKNREKPDFLISSLWYASYFKPITYLLLPFARRGRNICLLHFTGISTEDWF